MSAKVGGILVSLRNNYIVKLCPKFKLSKVQVTISSQDGCCLRFFAPSSGRTLIKQTFKNFGNMLKYFQFLQRVKRAFWK